jgi:DNA-binding NarL/FixJ family response regulator
MSSNKRRVFLIDDHPIVRQGLALLINHEPDLMVCGSASDARSAVSGLPKAKPDIILTDISMPGPDGLELIKNIRAILPNVPVLVLSMHDEALYTERVIKAGARGYIMKHEAEANIMTAIRRILQGEMYFSANMTNHFLQKLSQPAPAEARSPVEQLGDRELQIFRLLGKGRRTVEIAHELGIGVKTAETHLRRIRQKLGFRNYNEMTCQAAIWIQQQEH